LLTRTASNATTGDGCCTVHWGIPGGLHALLLKANSIGPSPVSKGHKNALTCAGLGTAFAYMTANQAATIKGLTKLEGTYEHQLR